MDNQPVTPPAIPSAPTPPQNFNPDPGITPQTLDSYTSQTPVAPDLGSNPSPSAPPKTKSSMLLGIGLAVFLLLAAGIGAYFYTQGDTTADRLVPPTAPTPTVTPDTEIWQTYINASDYSLNYPSSWVVMDEETKSPATLESRIVQIYDPTQPPTETNFTGIRIEYLGMPTNVDLTTMTESRVNGIMMYRQDTPHGQNFYINIPDTDQFLYVTGVSGNFVDEKTNQTVKKIFSTFKFIQPEQQGIPQFQPSSLATDKGATLSEISYTLPSGWESSINDGSLLITAPGGGFLSLKVYDNPAGDLSTHYCNLTQYCESGTTITISNIGNISGFKASGLDNSGGGEEYFGAKGSQFYVISTFSPPSPNEYEKNFQTVLNSLKF